MNEVRGPTWLETPPAQPVDATPSNALIRPCFPGRSDLFGCPRSKPSQGSVPADVTLASDLAFVFNASRVRLGRGCLSAHVFQHPDAAGAIFQAQHQLILTDRKLNLLDLIGKH